MGEIVSDTLVYNSITNTLGDEKLDARAPFSLIEFLNYSGNMSRSINDLSKYDIYLRRWQGVANVNLTEINADIKTQFTAFLSEVKLLYSSSEEKRYLDNINLQDEEQLSIAIPFFARKIKEISQYFSTKRKQINKDLAFIKTKGSDTGLIDSIKNELLDLYSGDDALSELEIPDNIGEFIDSLSIEVESIYDTFNDYYDLDPGKAPTFYDTISGDRFEYHTSNTNIISGDFFYDTEQAIKDIINTQGIVLQEIPGLLVDFDTTDISTLPKTYFQDYNNSGESNLKYILQAELVQKFMGTDMYYISSNSSNEILSGKMFDAQYPYRNLLNINNPSTIQVPGNDYKTEREVGLFFKPTNHGILKIDAAFDPVLDKRSIEADKVYMFPDPSRYGKISGVGESARESPFIFVLRNSEFKNNSSSFGKSLVKSDNDNQNFYSYSSLEQNNFTQTNEGWSAGLQASDIQGDIFAEVGDIYGNIFYTYNPTTIANKNLEGFTPIETPLGIAPTEYISLTADDRQTIDTKKRLVKPIYVYNTLKDEYQPIAVALKNVFSKYVYSPAIYNELQNSITGVDIYRNTFYIRTLNYLIIDNIIYNEDGTFDSKMFVSRVKEVNPAIATSQNNTQISNISNSVRIDRDVYNIKIESDLTTSPINSRIFYFSIFKYELDTQNEINIISDNTTNRSYFAENFTFDVGTNITQVRDMRLSYNKKQDKFFLLTDFADLNNTDFYHVLVFTIKGNKLTISKNFVISPGNDNLTSNFYRYNELVDNFTTQSLDSTPTQITQNGTLNF